MIDTTTITRAIERIDSFSGSFEEFKEEAKRIWEAIGDLLNRIEVLENGV